MKVSIWFIVAMLASLAVAAVLAFYALEGWGWFLFIAFLAGGAASDAHERETQ